MRCFIVWLLAIVVGMSTLIPSLSFLYAPPLPRSAKTGWKTTSFWDTRRNVLRRDVVRLAMANNLTLLSADNDEEPLAAWSAERPPRASSLMEVWDSFLTSSAYRTLLFTGALFSSDKVRQFLGVPGCMAVVSISFGIYFYETRFNYLVDVVTPRRQAALKAIRQYKTQQLSVAYQNNNIQNLQDLLNIYEASLREELQTRVLVPPKVWVIEMDPTQEDWSAAPQLLGLKITDQYTLERISRTTETTPSSSE